MRISLQEKEAILTAILAQDPTARIFLFGSRVEDSQKGGDIDLLVFSDLVGLDKKWDILAQIKSKIGDQKIDLLFKKSTEFQSDPFVRSVLPQAIILNKKLK